MSAKTIQIFLPAGDPRGIRIAEVTTRIVQVTEVPRSLLADYLQMPESDQVAVYFLVGESEDEEVRRVYIGQTGALRKRLAKHNKEKEFWQRALVLTSLTQSLTQTHALYLEWHCLQEARRAGRYSAENGTGGTKPHTPPPMEADCLEIFETGSTLLATLGFPLFNKVATRSSAEAVNDGPGDTELFYCSSSGADGKGLYTPEGFVVLAGSIGRKENVPSIQGTSVEQFRQRLLETGVVRVEGDKVVFTRDHLFKSPSSAGWALLGRRNNGWEEWKAADGRTLDEVKRQQTPSGEDDE